MKEASDDEGSEEEVRFHLIVAQDEELTVLPRAQKPKKKVKKSAKVVNSDSD